MVSREEHFARIAQQKQESKLYRERLGRAVGAILEYMRFDNTVLVDAGLFGVSENVSMFKKGKAYLSDDRVNQLPAVLTRAYQEATKAKFIPEEIRFYNAEQMIEKGERLANLDKDAMRAGLLYAIELTPELGSAKQRCINAGVADSLFYTFIYRNNSSLGKFDTMRTIIGGGKTLFELEEVGKIVLAYKAAMANPKTMMIPNPAMEAAAKKCETYNIRGNNGAAQGAAKG